MILLVSVAVWLAVVSIVAYFVFLKKDKKEVELRKHDWKSDTVYLYQFPRSKTIPNLSPYCLKVETFLKVNKIPYEVCPLIMGRSRYGLLPFIELNGEHIADSSVIIDRLKEHFKVKPLASPRDEGIVRAIERTVENHTANVVYRFKVVEDPNNGFCEAVLRDVGCPAVLLPIMLPLAAWCMRLKVSRRIGAAIGQFPVEDFKKFLQKDFDTYRDLLGDKKFLFGDEISSADCAVFSHLATVLYIPLNNYVKELLREKYPELTNYCDRVRDTVFGKEFAEE
nr:Glutathione S-transferase and Outer mitochondrial membrane transport complex protein domain containing protein [Haemonchus contortus]